MAIGKRVLRILFAAAFIITLLGGLGFGYQRIASARDRDLFRPIGELFSIQGQDMHLHCIGEGSPTVILENGVGGNTLLWSYLQPTLAGTTRVCAYDRAGYGWSTARPGERSVEQIAHELHALLSVAAIQPPYVLAGHSFGGLVARSYVHLYAEEVVGLILIDAAHPNQFSPDACVPGCFPGNMVSVVGSFYGMLPTLAQFGAVRLLVPTGLLPLPFFAVPGELPVRDALLASFATDSHSETVLREWRGYRESAAFVNAADDLGGLPLGVITALHTYVEQPLPGQESAVTTELWQTLQAELMTLSTHSQQLLMEDATHFSLLVDEEHVLRVSAFIQEFINDLR